MGADPVDSLRQMKNTVTDPYSKGRNFAGHFSVRAWNVVPVTSPIEIQYSIAIGTARAQRSGTGARGITIVQGGDAGSAEGDFATALVWSSRKGNELPLLMIVTNNRYGISTPFAGQHGYEYISDRGKAFGMPTAVVDGNDPEASYAALRLAIDYVRTTKKPYLLEAMVSRLRGHSSASGANLVANEADCLGPLGVDARRPRPSDPRRARPAARRLHPGCCSTRVVGCGTSRSRWRVRSATTSSRTATWWRTRRWRR